LDVDSLATVSGLSPSRFAHAFRSAMGCPPKQHLEHLRLERVCALLRTSRLSIKEIAVACGFRDADHCGERFRAAHGCTPSAWRKKQEMG
jgi:transcriptional regulator GlxA family with amidase domain